MTINKGLEGVVAAETALSLVDGERGELVIAGFAIAELAPNATFEETVSLLWDEPYVAGRRDVPASTIALLRDAARDCVDTMDALRMGAGTIRSAEPADVLAALPTLVAAYWRLLHKEEPVAPRGDLGHAANYLYMLSGETPSAERARDHVPRRLSRRRGRRPHGRAKRPAARRRAGAGARHGLRDRRRREGRGGAAAEDRVGGEAHGLRPPRLQSPRSARRRPRRGGGAALRARRRHAALSSRQERRIDRAAPARGVQARPPPADERRVLHRAPAPRPRFRDAALHADVRHQPRRRLDRPLPRAAAREPDHPAAVGLRRPDRPDMAQPGGVSAV